jgi:hypothetical protein
MRTVSKTVNPGSNPGSPVFIRRYVLPETGGGDPPMANVRWARIDGPRKVRMANTRYVKKASGGGWDIVKEGHRRATAHGATKADAVEAARKLVLQEGGGEIQVLNRTGKITAESTVSGARKRAAA